MKIGAKKKEELLRQLAQNPNISLRQLAKENNVGYSTLCQWRLSMQTASTKKTVRPETQAEQWSSRDKFLTVVAAKGMNAQEKSEYCRRKGLYPEQIDEWEKVCIHANGSAVQVVSELRAELKEEAKKVKNLERELIRKEKALAETAALLVLRKKACAIWGENEED